MRLAPLRAPLAYAAMIGATVLGFRLIGDAGRSLAAPPAGDLHFGALGPTDAVPVLPHVLLALVVIVVAARALGVSSRS